MIKIKKMYCTDDSLFDPIEFKDGFNIILGEKSHSSLKRNGVGKSISIEFLNFGLLKEFDKSRIKNIPSDIIGSDKSIVLELEISGKPIKIERSIVEHSDVTIYDGFQALEMNLSEAKNYLLNKIEFNSQNKYCSFRDLINPITRDERCEFKSIPDYSDTNVKVPVNFKPHFFSLGLSVDNLNSAMSLKKNINDLQSDKRKTVKYVETLLGKSIKEAKVELNRITDEKNKLEELLDNNDYSAFDDIDNEKNKLDIELREIRTKISTLKLKISQAKELGKNQSIDIKAVSDIYGKVKSSLGDSISRTLEEVQCFKNTIDAYTNNLINSRISSIEKEINSLQDRRSHLLHYRNRNESVARDIEYDQKEIVGEIAIKNDFIAELKSFLKKVESIESSISNCKLKLEEAKIDIKLELNEFSGLLDSFEQKILDAHSKLFDDMSASFSILVNDRKEIVDFNLRIKEDGGHSNERAKVFIYDFSLLNHDKKYSNHLGFLVHDNIFDNDDDTFGKALNYIESTLSSTENKQYILTLNSDKLDSIALNFDLNKYVIAKYTKNNKFLKRNYEEIK
ncbi:hypothetical protein BWP24_16340 [Vibrio campbellii]|uniref:DUF2326 domain-containing protein n=1 Tax=Vibrio campbellii TaxID=680 RepID=UPI0009719965|nr:DUF2326 domain-containing protein [Vibrio campbellii]APX07652.1 hypothetical protein BWP24_16340 [Vibrio campbellii]ARR07891.1 hypothetical protein Vc3S01_3132 [Vibrio campbellii]